MKATFMFAVSVLAIVAPALSQMSIDEMKEIAKKLMISCKDKAKAADVDLKSLREHKLPATKEGLCMLECFLDTTKIMDEGKYSKDGMITAFTPGMMGNKDMIAKLHKLADICEKKVGAGGDDKCNNAKDIAECIDGEGKTLGFEILKDATTPPA